MLLELRITEWTECMNINNNHHKTLIMNYRPVWWGFRSVSSKELDLAWSRTDSRTSFWFLTAIEELL